MKKTYQVFAVIFFGLQIYFLIVEDYDATLKASLFFILTTILIKLESIKEPEKEKGVPRMKNKPEPPIKP